MKCKYCGNATEIRNTFTHDRDPEIFCGGHQFMVDLSPSKKKTWYAPSEREATRTILECYPDAVMRAGWVVVGELPNGTFLYRRLVWESAWDATDDDEQNAVGAIFRIDAPPIRGGTK